MDQRQHQQAAQLQQILQPGQLQNREPSEEIDFDQPEEPITQGREEAMQFLNEANLRDDEANCQEPAERQYEEDQDDYDHAGSKVGRSDDGGRMNDSKDQECVYGDFEPSSFRNRGQARDQSPSHNNNHNFRDDIIASEVNRLYYKAQNYDMTNNDGKTTKIELEAKAPFVQPNQFLGGKNAELQDPASAAPLNQRNRSQSDHLQSSGGPKLRNRARGSGSYAHLADDKSDIEQHEDQPIPFSEIEKSSSEANDDLTNNNNNNMSNQQQQQHRGGKQNVFNTIQSTPTQPINEETQREMSSRINMTQYSIHHPKQKSLVDQQNSPKRGSKVALDGANLQQQFVSQNSSQQNLQIFIQSIDKHHQRTDYQGNYKHGKQAYQQAGVDQITESVPKPEGDETPTVVDEVSKYHNPYTGQLEKRTISESNSNNYQFEKSSINHSKDYFSFVEQQQQQRAQGDSDFVTNVYKGQQYPVSITNPYIMHRNSPLITRDKDSSSLLERDTPQLAPRESSDIQNSNSSKREGGGPQRKQRASDVQQKLEQIEMQVQQKQMEINRQRMQAKYTGVHLDYFKPEVASQHHDHDNIFGPTIMEKQVLAAADVNTSLDNKARYTQQSQHPQAQQRASDLEDSAGTKRLTYGGYHSNQRSSADLNNDYYQKVISRQIHVDSRGSKIGDNHTSLQRLKQTKSLPITAKKQATLSQKAQALKQQQNSGAGNGGDRNSQVGQNYSIKKAIVNLDKQSDKHQQIGTNLQQYTDAQAQNNQSLEDIINSSDYMNKTIMSRQLINNFNLNNSVQLDQEIKERNQLFIHSEFRDNEKNYTMIDDDDFADQTLTFGHDKQPLQATDKTSKTKQQMISTKDSGNIRQIISTIEKNKELSHLDLSLDLKSQMKQCSTTRRDAQQNKDETFLFEQYGLSSNVVIHPQDRKRLQDSGKQAGPSRKSGTSGLMKSKNMKSVKNLKSQRQISQQNSEVQQPVKIDKQASLTAKKQKSQSSATKKKVNKSDRKSIIKKEISLYHESDEKVQISQFHPQEMQAPTKKASGRKKWMPSIDNLGAGIEQREKSSSSTSDMPQPEQYSQIAPQPMDVMPKIQNTSEQNSRESMQFSQHSSNSNISLVEERQSQMTGSKQINQSSDHLLHNFNSVNSRQMHHQLHAHQDVNRTQNHISKSYVQISSQSPSPNVRPSHQRVIQQHKDIQDEILQHLLKEEDILYKYATESTAEIQHSENQAVKGQSPTELSQRNKFIIYQKLLIDARIEKPRFILFARQLQVSFMITRALIRVLPPTLMQRFEAKIKALCQNIHQSFLLIIDLILKQFQSEMTRQDGGIYFNERGRGDIHHSVDFKLLRNITSKKIKSKDNFARTLTIFRQNNEINVLYLKKIIKYILDSYSTDCVPFKPVALDFQEIIRINYGSANTAAGTQSSNREESKVINYSVLAQKEKEIVELNSKLQEQIEVLIQRPGVIINRQVVHNHNQSNAREPIHMSPSKNDEEVEQQNSPQPQTYRHLSPIKTTQDNFAAKDHEILKRCKSTSKNMQINKTHLRSTQVRTYGQKQSGMPQRDLHNMSMSSVVQKQRMNPIISQNVYRGLNEMPVDHQQQRRTMNVQAQQNMPTGDNNSASFNNPQQNTTKMRINDLISGSSGGKNMGVLAHRRNSKQKSNSPNMKNHATPAAVSRKGGQTLHQNASVMHLGQSGKYSAMNCNESNHYEQISDIDLQNAHSTERIERSSNYTFKTKSVKSVNKPESAQRTLSSQAPGTSAQTKSSLGADYIRKKYDPQGYRRINQNTYGQSGQKYQCRFNDRERGQKFTSNDQRTQLKVKIGDNRQLVDLNTSVNNTSMMQHQPMSGVSQKRGSLGHQSPMKGSAVNTFGSPQKVNSLMKRYGSQSKIQTIQQQYQQQPHLGSSHMNDNYQSKAKIVTVQQQQQHTQHQFNKVQNNFNNQSLQKSSSGSKSHPVNSRGGGGVLSNRTKLMQQQEIVQHDPPVNTSQQNQQQSWGFMLPESKDFILRMSNDASQQEMVDQSSAALLSQQQLPGSNRGGEHQQPPPIAQITNVNNNINFYGTVVNHVYSPGDTGRESQSVDQNYQGQFFSPPKQSQQQQQQQMSFQPQIGSHLQNSQLKSRGRLTTEKKSSQVGNNKGVGSNLSKPENMNQHQFNEYILDQMDDEQQLMMQDPDSGLFKQASNESKRMLKVNQSHFDELHYDQSIMIDNMDNSMDMVVANAQNNNNQAASSFAQSFIFESNSPTMLQSPEKRMQENLNKSRRSKERQTTAHSGRKVTTTIEKTVQLQYKMHSTGIGSGIKNLKQKQQSLQSLHHSSSKQSQFRSNNQLSTGKRKDTRKEVVKPSSRGNMPQSQRDVPLVSNILQKNVANTNFSHRNSFEVVKENPAIKVSSVSDYGNPIPPPRRTTTQNPPQNTHQKTDSTPQPHFEQPPLQSEKTQRDQEEEVGSHLIREYNENLLQVEDQTNVSSSMREMESVTDIRTEMVTPVPDKKPAVPQQMTAKTEELDLPPAEEEEEEEEQEEEQDKESGSHQDASNIHNTSNVEAEIDQDDEQALIDAEYQRLRKLVKVPYLPALSQTELSKLPSRAKCIEDIYTLVLDLDETLIHFEMDEEVDPAIEEPGYYLIRPGAIKFLNELAEYYELVVFTAAMPDYADWILDNVDRHNKISFRLYRQHSTPFEDYAMKDLTKLGRDMSKTIIIDNLAENFNQITPLNGIWVESWYDDMDDIVLQLLIPFLIDIVKNKVDVRLLLTDKIKEEVIYKKLDEGKSLPQVKDILKKYPSSSDL